MVHSPALPFTRQLVLPAFGLAAAIGASLACETPMAGDCVPGAIGCECINGVACVNGAFCDLGICRPVGGGETEEESGSASGDGDGEPGDGDPGDGDPGDGTCRSSSDCLDTEVCVEGLCGDTDLYYFDVRVVVFEPALCRDGVGNAELLFEAYQDDVLTFVSSEVGCPGAWPNEPFEYDSLQSLALDFYEIDAFFDDFIVRLCWVDELAPDLCLPVPKTVLHDGGWMGWAGDSYIELNFDVRAP